MQKRILYISGSMPPLKCGIGFYMNRFLEYADPGFDLLTTKGLQGHDKANKTFYTPDWKSRRLYSLVKLCRKERYDIIHTQYPAKGYGRKLGINKLPYLLRWFTHSTIIVTLHEYHGSGLLGKTRDFITALPAHRIIVSNPYDLKALPAVLRRKTVIIPIGSSFPTAPKNRKFYEEALAAGGLDARARTAVFFGFAFPNKGIELAIKAAEKAKLQLLLLTELTEADPYHQHLLNLVDEARGRGAKVYAAGYLDDTRASQVLQECDYFLLPQPLPLTAKSGTAIAAAQHGLLIVSTASNDPALNLPYKNGINSVLLSSMSESALAEALSKLEDVRSDVSLEKELAQLAAYFSWESIATKHRQLYEEVTK